MDLFYTVGKTVNWHSLSGGKFEIFINGPLTSVCALQGTGEIKTMVHPHVSTKFDIVEETFNVTIKSR